MTTMNQDERVEYLKQFMPTQFWGQTGDVEITVNVTRVESKTSVFGEQIVIHVLEVAGVDVRENEPMLFTPHHVQNGIAIRCSTYYVDESNYDHENRSIEIPSGQGKVVCVAK